MAQFHLDNLVDTILDSIADGVFTVDQDFQLTSFNRAAEDITKFSREDAIGQFCYEIFRANVCFEACALRETLETGKNIVNREITILNAENEEIPVSISTAVLRDKDGTFAALLAAEIAAWAKEQGTNLIELLDKYIYLDTDIGLFVNLYEPDPLDGEYPGIEGDRLKKAILRRAIGYFQLALSGDLEIAGIPVKSASIYRTGKYDTIYPPTYDFQFPDEGVRFFFDEEKLQHVTIRPSGTGNALRFHIQLHDNSVTESNLIEKKEQLLSKGQRIMDSIREFLKAPRTRQTPIFRKED